MAATDRELAGAVLATIPKVTRARGVIVLEAPAMRLEFVIEPELSPAATASEAVGRLVADLEDVIALLKRARGGAGG